VRLTERGAAGIHSILIGTRKRLKIAVNHRKQKIEVVSNRYKIGGYFRHSPRGAGTLLPALASRKLPGGSETRPYQEGGGAQSAGRNLLCEALHGEGGDLAAAGGDVG
jgi:hypothetical protein